MTTNDPNSNDSSKDLTETQIEALIAQAEEMIWMLLDGHLSEIDCERLEQILLKHEQVRQRYLECVQMHVELQNLCGKDAPTEIIKDQVPILGQLGNLLPDNMSGIGNLPPLSPDVS